MPQVIWLPEALEDIERLHRFLAEHNPHAARNAALCIQAATGKHKRRWLRTPELLSA
jgi:plasmid stabilization system protein ParE